MFLAALATLLIGLSSMEPGSKKRPIGTFSHCCLWPRAGSQRQTNTKFSGVHPILTGYPSLEPQPPSQVPMEMENQETLLQGLGSEMRQGWKVVECVG